MRRDHWNIETAREHPHPKYALATLQATFQHVGIDAEFQPFRVVREPYLKGTGPGASWEDPLTGTSCQVWAEYETWEDDPDEVRDAQDAARFERWKAEGDGWYWDLSPDDGDWYGHNSDLVAAIREATLAAWSDAEQHLAETADGMSPVLLTWLREFSAKKP
jgi:hypothetical protein